MWIRVLTLLLLIPTISLGDEKPDMVFLMIGQSNMAGRAAMEPQDKTPLKVCNCSMQSRNGNRLLTHSIAIPRCVKISPCKGSGQVLDLVPQFKLTLKTVRSA